jgi:hypothetical protein
MQMLKVNANTEPLNRKYQTPRTDRTDATQMRKGKGQGGDNGKRGGGASDAEIAQLTAALQVGVTELGLGVWGSGFQASGFGVWGWGGTQVDAHLRVRVHALVRW